jgi:gamma-glutamylcyclotransferase (GGCT)/AIG2-like uncharacterized protein YtfP
MPLCFAYGSNMDRAAMVGRCPGARVVGLARLARHRLALMREGYATVVRDPHRSVHGLLWDVPLADLPALDRYEGVGEGLYVKRQQSVVTASGARRALVYLGTNAGPGRLLPGYLEGVLAAARDVGLPAGAIAEIAALAPGGLRIAGPKSVAPEASRGPVPGVRPTRATPLSPARIAGGSGWSWTP